VLKRRTFEQIFSESSNKPDLKKQEILSAYFSKVQYMVASRERGEGWPLQPPPEYAPFCVKVDTVPLSPFE
jgi:hypothetical protein